MKVDSNLVKKTKPKKANLRSNFRGAGFYELLHPPLLSMTVLRHNFAQFFHKTQAPKKMKNAKAEVRKSSARCQTAKNNHMGPKKLRQAE